MHPHMWLQAARGAYIWWQGCNRLLLLDFESLEAAKALSQHSSTTSTSSTPPAPPATPGHGGASSSGHGRGGLGREYGLVRSWVLPHGITACACTADAKTLALGLANGSVLVWDDSITAFTKVSLSPILLFNRYLMFDLLQQQVSLPRWNWASMSA